MSSKGRSAGAVLDAFVSLPSPFPVFIRLGWLRAAQNKAYYIFFSNASVSQAWPFPVFLWVRFAYSGSEHYIMILVQIYLSIGYSRQPGLGVAC